MKLSELIEVIIDLFISLILIIYTTVYKAIKAHIELRLRAAKFAIIFLIVVIIFLHISLNTIILIYLSQYFPAPSATHSERKIHRNPPPLHSRHLETTAHHMATQQTLRLLRGILGAYSKIRGYYRAELAKPLCNRFHRYLTDHQAIEK